MYLHPFLAEIVSVTTMLKALVRTPKILSSKMVQLTGFHRL